MDPERAVACLALAWLIVSILSMMWMIGKARALAKKLAERHPQAYRALGCPLPSLLHSSRGRRFAQFVARREFENLGDPELSAEFDAYKRQEARVVISLLACMLIVFVMMMVVRNAF